MFKATKNGVDARPNRRVLLVAVSVGAGLIVAACSSQGGGPTTTTADTTTTTIQDTTTTTASPPTTANPPTDTNDLASGSGCKPGSDDGLPDGEWYGYLADVSSSEVEFDLACWFSGDAAVTAASEDGAESPPPNDYYIRNQSEALRSLAVDGSAEVEYLANGGDPNSATTTSYEEWHAEWEIDGFSPGYWLTIEDGQVTRIIQQYVP